VKEIFSTGDVARACRISIAVVIKAFDTGLLKGYLLPPGRKIRRFTRGQVERFRREQGLPFDVDGKWREPATIAPGGRP